MSNVIKQRQLSNGDKLTPKTDFKYKGEIYNINGTIKISTPSGVGQSPISVGKGQVIRLGGSSELGYMTIDLTDKKTNSVILRENIDIWTNAETYRTTKNIITFLGKPFTASGDNDRYVIVNYFNGSNYSLMLLNIDKWTYQVRDLSTDSAMYDLTFNGVDTCYLIRGGSLHQITIRLNDFDSTPQSPVYLADGTTRISATRIYGVSAERIAIKGVSNELQVYNLTDLSLKTKGDTINCIDTSTQEYLVGRTNGNIEYLNIGLNSQYNLTQSLVEGLIIGSGETNVAPQLITNFVETDTTIEFEWVLTRNLTDRVVGDCVKTTITKSDSSIVSTRLTTVGIDPIAPAGTSQEQLNNSFSNTCNSYGVGKFYDYGLQKQWDSRTLKNKNK